MDKELKRYASEKSKFLSLKDGQEVTARFLSYEIVPDHFKSGEKCVRYHLELDGVKKMKDSSSASLAEQMSAVSPGEIITIKQEGLGTDTTYTVTRVAEE